MREMTTEPDPAEAVPTNNSTGAPVDERQLEAAETDPADAAEAALEATPGPAGGDPVIEGIQGEDDPR
jgi:hypothetical protein